MQYSLNKDHQHHKWQQQKSWTLNQYYQDAQDKQQTQYPRTPRSEWKTHRRYWKFQSQNVQIFWYIYRNTNDLIHGPLWKTQLLLLNGICTVILQQDYYANGNLRKFYWNTVRECLFVNREGLFSSVYVDDVKLAGKKQTVSPSWTSHERLSKDMVGNYRSMFESRISAGATEKIPETKSHGNLLPKQYLRGRMTWKVMQRNAWKDIANLRIKQLSNYTSRNAMHGRSSI